MTAGSKIIFIKQENIEDTVISLKELALWHLRRTGQYTILAYYFLAK